MTELPKVRIRGLYKIFGETPEAMMPHVLAGMTKAELLPGTIMSSAFRTSTWTYNPVKSPW